MKSCTGSWITLSNYIAVLLVFLDVRYATAVNVTFITITSMQFLSAVPAIETAISEIQTSSLDKISIQHVLIYRKSLGLCEMMADHVVDLASGYYYRKKAGSALYVFIAPSCSGDIFALGPLAKEWNVPLLSFVGTDPAFGDKTKYPTVLTVAMIQHVVMSNFIVQFVASFKWTNLYLLCDDKNDIAFYRVTCRNFRSLFKPPKYQLNALQFNSEDGPVNYDFLLDVIKPAARVIFLLASAAVTRSFMIKAESKNMTGPEYVYIYIYSYSIYDVSWRANDGNDKIAFQAFNSLLVATFDTERESDALPPSLSEAIKYRSKLAYNITYAPSEKVSAVTVAAYESTLLIGKVLDECLAEKDTNFSNGAKFSSRFWNRTFDLLTGNIYINEAGNRYPDVIVKQLSGYTQKSEPVLVYSAATKQLTNLTNTGIIWVGGRAPKNEPECGFSGNKCSLTGSSNKMNITISIVVLLIMIGAITTGVLIQRHLDHQARLRDTWWTISSTELVRIKVDTGPLREQLQGKYKGNIVWLKQINLSKPPVVSNEQHLFFSKIKLLDHKNVNLLLGLVLEQSLLTFVSKLYIRGSLQDLYHRMKSDWDIKSSLTNDLAQGMDFLYKSFVQIHGRLSSTKCLIDNRFGLQISDFGYNAILEQFLDNDGKLAAEWKQDDKNLLWVAPEILAGKSAFSHKSDMFAFGIILFEITAWKEPYAIEKLSGISEAAEFCWIARKVLDSETPPFRPKFSEEFIRSAGYGTMVLIATIRACWNENPTRRPAIGEVIKTLRRASVVGDKNFLDKMLARLRKNAEDLEDIVYYRTLELKDERQRCDDLLREILPKEMVQKLRYGEIIEPEVFASVTIYFSDVCGFVDFVAENTPFRVIQLLGKIYTIFDTKIVEFDAYKVETIADSYMVVSGLPVPNGNQHALEIGLMSIQFLSAFRNEFSLESLELRIGINSGPCAAGVVGKKSPRYCLFGDTVNTASRMESTGIGSKIHISPSTYGYVKTDQRFVCEPRGYIFIKGKGEVMTYWLTQHGIRMNDRVKEC